MELHQTLFSHPNILEKMSLVHETSLTAFSHTKLESMHAATTHYTWYNMLKGSLHKECATFIPGLI